MTEETIEGLESMSAEVREAFEKYVTMGDGLSRVTIYSQTGSVSVVDILDYSGVCVSPRAGYFRVQVSTRLFQIPIYFADTLKEAIPISDMVDHVIRDCKKATINLRPDSIEAIEELHAKLEAYDEPRNMAHVDLVNVLREHFERSAAATDKVVSTYAQLGQMVERVEGS